MKKQDSLQAFALAEAQMLEVKGGAYTVTYQDPASATTGTIRTDVLDGIRVGGTLPGTNFIVIDVINDTYW